MEIRSVQLDIQQFQRLLRLRMPDVIYCHVAGNSPLVYEANENGGPSNYVSRSAKPAKLPVSHVGALHSSQHLFPLHAHMQLWIAIKELHSLQKTRPPSSVQRT